MVSDAGFVGDSDSAGRLAVMTDSIDCLFIVGCSDGSVGLSIIHGLTESFTSIALTSLSGLSVDRCNLTLMTSDGDGCPLLCVID